MEPNASRRAPFEQRGDSPDRRILPDRRLKRVRAALCSFYKRQRREPQRFEERKQPHYTDVYERWVLAVAFILALLSTADAVFTLRILERGGAELNPLMDYVIGKGDLTFFTVKLCLTALCVFIAVVHINFKVLRYLPMRQVLCGLFAFYVALVAYEIVLLAS